MKVKIIEGNNPRELELNINEFIEKQSIKVSDKYREWLQDPILHDIRRVAVMVGFVYA